MKWKLIEAAYDPNNIEDIKSQLIKKIYNKGKINIDITYKNKKVNVGLYPELDYIENNEVWFSSDFLTPVFLEIDIKNDKVYLKAGYHESNIQPPQDSDKTYEFEKTYDNVYNVEQMYNDVKSYFDNYIKNQFKYFEEENIDVL